MRNQNTSNSGYNSSSNSGSTPNSKYNIIKLVNKNDWVKILKLLKKKTLTPSTRVNEGNTVSHIAFNQGIIPVIKYISRNYPELLKQLDSNGQSCLHILIKNAKYDIFLNCLEVSNDSSLINAPNHNMRTPVMYLIKHVDNNEVYRLLKKLVHEFKHIDYYAVDNENKSIIHGFIKRCLSLHEQGKDKLKLTNKLFNLFKYVLENYDIDVNYNYKLPLLTYTINETNSEDIGLQIIKLLLHHKADPNTKNTSSIALAASIKKNYNRTSILLLDHQANPNYQGSYGLQDPMFHAISKNNDAMVCKLLDFGYDCKLYDKNLNTAAHQVLIQDPPLKYSTIFKVLGNKNTNMQHKNINNDTVIDILQAKHNTNIFKRILDYKLGNNEITNKCIKRTKNTQDTNSTVKIIKFPNYNNTHTKSFITTPLYNILYTLVILLKHNNICIPFQFNNFILKTDSINRLTFYYDNHNDILFDIVNNYTNVLYSYLPHLILWKSPKEYFIHPDLKIHILKCMNKHNNARFIMVKISLLVSNTSTHANVLVIDKQTGNVDRFDPYGYITLLDTEVLDKILEAKLTKIFKPFFKVNYLRTKAGYNLVSFQTISNDDSVTVKRGYDPFGYCLAWCLWYVELRLTNPDVHPHFLIKQCIERIVSSRNVARTNYASSEEVTETNLENTKSFNNYIRSYAASLDAEKNKLLESFGINSDNAYDIVFNSTQHSQIIDRINDTFYTKIIPLTWSTS